VSAVFCCGCTAATGPDIGRVIDTGPVRQPAAGSGELLHCGNMTAPLPAADDEGILIRGIVAPAPAALAADVSIGGLEMTDRLIISVSILSCTITSPHLSAQYPRVGPGHPSSPLVHLLPHLFPFSLFPFFH